MRQTDGAAQLMHRDIATFVRTRPPILRSGGPLAVVLAEDEVERDSTLRHLLTIGFPAVVLLCPEPPHLPSDLVDRVTPVRHDPARDGALPAVLTALVPAVAEGTWLHGCHNAEYLFYPFCETRSISELLAFHAEERRAAMVATVVDVYAADLETHPLGVDRETAHFDTQGYYALDREDPERAYAPRERQIDIYGGLRWRFEEHVPWERRRIDRVALFRARRGLRMNEDHTLNDEEMNTIQCAWHRNLTAAVVSFRTAKALRMNPGSRAAIDSFLWPASRPFDWTGRQLLEAGLMEPGQWF